MLRPAGRPSAALAAGSIYSLKSQQHMLRMLHAGPSTLLPCCPGAADYCTSTRAPAQPPAQPDNHCCCGSPTCSTMSKKISFFLYFKLSLRHPTAPVTCRKQLMTEVTAAALPSQVSLSWHDSTAGSALPRDSCSTAAIHQGHRWQMSCKLFYHAAAAASDSDACVKVGQQPCWCIACLEGG